MRPVTEMPERAPKAMIEAMANRTTAASANMVTVVPFSERSKQVRNSYCNSGPGASAYNGNGASNSQGGPVQLIITGWPLNLVNQLVDS